MLVAAAREVGGAQIQNRGTLGGNIANASPAGDTLRGPQVRIAFGSVGPTVVLARKTAAILQQGGSMADAQAMLLTEIAPIDDIRSTREYRAQVAANLLAEFWNATK